jgi:hypothetical protein
MEVSRADLSRKVEAGITLWWNDCCRKEEHLTGC